LKRRAQLILISRAAAAILSAAALASCQSSGGGGQTFAAQGQKNTGEYPKIGYIPVGETAQLGADGTAALRGELATARAAQSANAGAPESYAAKLARLRKLGQAHSQATLAEIEARKPL
jgi:hypothetical protein